MKISDITDANELQHFSEHLFDIDDVSDLVGSIAELEQTKNASDIEFENE
jgi:hypothetical protein